MDSAVGYVEVKRTSATCIVRAKIVPEHRVTNKQYLVTVTLDEHLDEIKDASCDGCVASAGGCKHTMLLMFWLDKKSKEPASTSVQCYWKKPSLAGVRADPVECEDVFPNAKKIKLDPKDPSILAKFLEECKKHNVSNSLATSFTMRKKSYNLFDMSIEYFQQESDEDVDKYIISLNRQITEDVIHTLNKKTQSQVDTKLWHSLRQGRITASKVYEAAKCKTEGTLVQQILGGYKVPETEFIRRGKKLEKFVVKKVKEKINKKIEKSGFTLINAIVGASPDGVRDDFVV